MIKRMYETKMSKKEFADEIKVSGFNKNGKDLIKINLKGSRSKMRSLYSGTGRGNRRNGQFSKVFGVKYSDNKISVSYRFSIIWFLLLIGLATWFIADVFAFANNPTNLVRNRMIAAGVVNVIVLLAGVFVYFRAWSKIDKVLRTSFKATR